MSNLEGMTCPKCGGQIYFDDNGQEYVFCSHCGTQIFKEDTHFDRRISHEEKKMKYADRAEERASRDIRNVFIAFGVMLIFLLIWFSMLN